MRRFLFAPLALLLLLAPTLRAQESDSGEDTGDPFLDPAIAPLIIPTVDDYAPVATDSRGTLLLPTGAAVNTYFEITSDQKSGLLTPSYSFANGLAFKARIPLIFKRTVHFFGTDGSAGGLGDISLDAEYTRPFSPGSLARLQATLKLPTGDDEKEDNGVPVPLGTGSTDLFLRGQYARSTARTGFLLGAIFRHNSSRETTDEYGFGLTRATTLGDQFITSAFARYAVFNQAWVHLGGVLTVLGSGEIEISTDDGSPPSTIDMNHDGTLFDLYPGISYQLGPLQPFLGLRIPVATNYDNEYIDTDRDLSLILQFTYRPERLAFGD